MSSCLDGIDDGHAVFLADGLIFGFDHDTDDRLSTGFTDQDPAGVAQLFSDLFYLGLYDRIVLGFGLAGDSDIDQLPAR